MKEKCGVFGIYNSISNINIIPSVITGLKLLQHRGQEGCGIAFENNKQLDIHKGLGLVTNVFNDDISIETNKCIGHVRYSTSGNSKINEDSKISETQPLEGNADGEEFYISHNGNIPKIKTHDTQYIIDFINKSECRDFEEKLISLMKTIPCAYSILILTNNCIYGMRDRYGIRPLCIGTYDKSYCISSESCAFQHFKLDRDVLPGEIIKINNNGLQTIYQYDKSKLSICAFEYLYFLNPSSICDGYNVTDVRNNLGKLLANKETLTIDDQHIVIGIPNSGILSAKSYASSLSIKYIQAISKNKSSNRTFIIPNNEDRIKACNEKFIYDQDSIAYKKVIIIDDTIVRGNVIKSIINNLELCKASEIHIRIAAPPIINICQLGIDIPSCEELLAYNKNIAQITDELNVTSIKYLSVEELNNIIPPSSYKQCFGEEIDKKMIEW
tara:strand:+ start:5565 stop:6890 length:1326 start_codon:yes stop_codon:yes gene_type:complete